MNREVSPRGGDTLAMLRPLDAAEVRLLTDAQVSEIREFACSARLHALDGKSETPLHIAARCGKLALCDLLIRHGADPNLRNVFGETAAEVAAVEGHIGLSQLLRALEIDTGNTIHETPATVVSSPSATAVADYMGYDLSFEAEADPEAYRTPDPPGFSDNKQAAFSPFKPEPVNGAPDWHLDLSATPVTGEGIGSTVVALPNVAADDEFLVTKSRGRKSNKTATLSVGTRMSVDSAYVEAWASEAIEYRRIPQSDLEALISACRGNADRGDLWRNIAGILDFAGLQQVDDDDLGLWNAPVAVDGDDLAEALEVTLTRHTRLPGSGRFHMDRADQAALIAPMLQTKGSLHLALVSNEEAVGAILRFVEMVLAGQQRPEYLTLLAVFPERENDPGSMVLREVADTLRVVASGSSAIEGKRRRVAIQGLERLDLSAIFFKAIGKYLSEQPGQHDAASAMNELIAEMDSKTARLLMAHLPYARRFASRHAEDGEDLEDVFQVAFTGLQKATRRFDPDRGTPFSLYASNWMRQTVTRWRADERAMIRIPVHRHSDLAALDETHDRLELVLGRTPTSEEIAFDREWRRQHVEKLLETPRVQVDWDELGLEWLSVPADQEARVEELDTATVVSEALGELHDREADIIRKRFGFDEAGEMTLEEVGQIYGVTRERIRQIEAKALRKLSNSARVRRLRSLVGA